MPGRIPNSGPYIVSHRISKDGAIFEHERHTWADACALMRQLLIDGGYDIQVRFA